MNHLLGGELKGRKVQNSRFFENEKSRFWRGLESRPGIGALDSGARSDRRWRQMARKTGKVDSGLERGAIRLRPEALRSEASPKPSAIAGFEFEFFKDIEISFEENLSLPTLLPMPSKPISRTPPPFDRQKAREFKLFGLPARKPR